MSSNELLDDIVYKSDNNIYEQTSKQASAYIYDEINNKINKLSVSKFLERRHDK